MPLLTIGINHKTAPIEVRERVAFTPEGLGPALRDLARLPAVQEAAIVSTCNRTELYLYLDQLEQKTTVVEWLASQQALSVQELSAYLYEYDEARTVQHILRVASGIDSMILGEPQILGQMKDAYREALAARSLGLILGRLFQHTFTIAKMVRTHTAIGASSVSVAFAAVQLAQQIFGNLNEHTVLLIGAGETIELAARHLHQNGIGRMIVANRTLDRAHTLAVEFGGYAIGLPEIPLHLAEADIVISSTASQTVILERTAVEQAMRSRRHRPMFLVDLAVPRDFEARIGELDDVYLYTIDDLQQVVSKNLQSRQQAAVQGDEIISVQVGHFLAWKKSLEAVDTICTLRALADVLKAETLENALRQLRNGKSPEEALGYLAHTLTNKLIHAPSANLTEAGRQGRSELIKAARTLFDLDALETLLKKE